MKIEESWKNSQRLHETFNWDIILEHFHVNFQATYNKYRKIFFLNVDGICVDDVFSGT